MRKAGTLWWLGVFGALFSAGCGSNAKPEAQALTTPVAPVAQLEGKLEVTGSSTVAPVVLEAAKRFEKLHPAVRINVQTGGSSRGVADPQKGIADIGMASRALKEDEAKTVVAHLIALDGICVILHKTNRVENLSDEQVMGIYLGKWTNWKDVGGRDAPITVVNKAEGRSTLELFAHYFKLKTAEIKASVIIGDNEQGIKTVAGNPDAIGYVSIGSAEYAAAQGTNIKLLPMNGIAASVENVRNKTFPLSRPLNLVTLPDPNGLKKAFIDYVQSEQVEDLVKELSFVPVR
ncbi:MAG: phosphate ABC transporter substrate-binding protein [Planctomycetes bacterium]|nr:phosphate ABC transporter substrate-binding protein [Planctomycetota bacterium]